MNYMVKNFLFFTIVCIASLYLYIVMQMPYFKVVSFASTCGILGAIFRIFTLLPPPKKE